MPTKYLGGKMLAVIVMTVLWLVVVGVVLHDRDKNSTGQIKSEVDRQVADLKQQFAVLNTNCENRMATAEAQAKEARTAASVVSDEVRKVAHEAEKGDLVIAGQMKVLESESDRAIDLAKAADTLAHSALSTAKAMPREVVMKGELNLVTRGKKNANAKSPPAGGTPGHDGKPDTRQR